MIDPSSFRDVLGHFATGVAVITAHDGEPVGMAVNSFTSVSLDPPLVAFCAATSSATWPRIRAAGRFAVSVLDAAQAETCRRFASKDGDRFGGCSWSPSRGGSPVLDDALAWIDCEIDAEHEAGDHVIVVGRVTELATREGEPLIFYRGGYRVLEAC